jgi:hypothetical protein
MRKRLAILGHKTRGHEVIELLKMMGGSNIHNLSGNDSHSCYFIKGFKNEIRDELYLFGNENINYFTLEEFLEVYPFKIGDKVIDTADGCQGVVCEMKWDEEVSDMKYCVEFENDDFGWFANDSIEFCKENKNLGETQSNQDIDKDVFRKEFCECCGSQRCSGQDDELEDCERFKNLMDNSGKQSDENHKMGPKSKLPSKYYEDRLEETQPKRDIDKSEFIIKHMILPNKMDDKLEYEIIDGYEFDKVENNKIILKPIKPKYPTTYEECCEIIHSDLNFYIDTHLYSGILETLYKLLICRTAYWKIAGEELGLNKPWEPQFENCSIPHYCIFINHRCEVCNDYFYGSRCLLAFPTEKIRDIFYENFKDLIEQCKELL